MGRPRIAWFSPVQPVESGISLYTEDIVPVLAAVLDVDVIVDNYRPSAIQEDARLRVRPVKDYDAASYDLAVYQVGNSPAHIYMLDELYRRPGLLVLHDTMLNHLFIQRAAQSGTLNEYHDEMKQRYGEAGAQAAARVLKGQAPDDLFRFPLSEPLVSASLATLVHSEYARQQALTWEPGANVVRVPHGLHMPEPVDQAIAKRALGIPEDQMLIVSVSHINPHKRIDVVLRALKQIRGTISARLILAGSVSPNFPIRRMISHLGLEQVVDVPGYVEDEEARLISAAADVIVNLRYPTAGETSGSLLHSMAAGRPVLISETGSFDEVPQDAAIRIPVDSLEEPMLISVFKHLWDDVEFRDAVGTKARQFIETEHSIQRWVNGYVDTISELLGSPLDYPFAVSNYEPVPTGIRETSDAEGVEIARGVARDIAELGLGGDDELLQDVAVSQVELGLGVGMIKGWTGD
jgi:glycosyltransferase involved in cell wall biosynthesis